MDKHTVTIQDVLPAMETEIVLASAVDCRAKTKKHLKFHVSELKYRVTFEGVNEVSSNSYRHPQDAIDKYNEY